MINCPKCRAQIDNDSHYCDQCGQEILFCTQCHRPGKGKRCTYCGGKMIVHGESENEVTNVTHHVTIRESMNATAQGATHRSGIPQMFLVNDSLHVRMAAVDGAILGRSNGIYKNHLMQCNYISGTHAQLNYIPGSGWCITDKNSSNGTSVNHQRLMAEMPSMLRNGDRLLLANVEFRVETK